MSTRTSTKNKSCKLSLRISWTLLDTVNQNVQEALKKFQDTKNKEYEKTQKQINELIGALNKHESETENTTIEREMN
jgi:uncharacterized protein involved in exopolysaccharide biosynthesis